MARLKLKQISGNTWYIPAPVNIGVCINDNRAILIDSGNDREAGRQISKLLGEQGLELELIINTHSNADHIGGNAFLQKKTGCRIAASRLESAFIQDPVLEPAYLFGGFPSTEMRNKFLMAKPSTVTDVIPSTGTIPGTDLEVIPLPGHFFDMIGIRTPDDVAFIADSLFPENVISKYHIVFLYDIRAQLETLNRLETLQADHYLPSHGKLTADIRSLIDTNRKKIEEIIGRLLDICRNPVTVDDVFQAVCRAYAIELNPSQYVLVNSTVKSYLAYLIDGGKLEMDFHDGRMLLQTVR